MSKQQSEFAEFYAASLHDCLRAVLASTGDRQAAEESVAEAFARAWESWRTVRRHPVPRGWVVRTALNLHVSWWRRRSREVPLRAGTDRPAVAAGITEVDAEIMAVLARLPERQRQVVALRIFLDLDTAGTAQVLGIAPGTVSAHLARATAALRTELHTRQET